MRCRNARGPVVALTVLAVLGLASCQVTPEPRDSPISTALAPARGAPGVVSKPVHIQALDPNEVPATYVLRGGSPGKQRMVFLHGMCGHALGYAQSFQYSAARHGRIVAPQADVVCGKGPWAKWSHDVAALHERIERAFIALGDQPPIDDICVMGYSQGATRAVELARKYPDSYSRLISIGAPGAAQPQGLSHLKAALMMAGERDRQDQMQTSARRFAANGIRSEFREIPKATHGSMGPHPEQTMAEALDWVFASGPSPASSRD
ncbi:MAG TPA: hypothetical protein VFU02_01460 [Polyangiaceae bacterium]|nr:hypothetical protein [Polyangiaceae bacterium]